MIRNESSPRRIFSPSKTARTISVLVMAGAAGLASQRGEDNVNQNLTSLTPPSTTLAGTIIPDLYKDLIFSNLSLEEKKITQLKDGISERFGIYVETVNEISQIPTFMSNFIYEFEYGPNNFSNQNQDWNEENLKLLQKALSYLPKTTYQEKDKEKVHFILGPIFSCGGDAKTFTTLYPREIMLSSSYFRPETPLTAVWALIHESVHLRTLPSCSSINASTIENSPYFEKLDKILGGSYVQVREELLQELKNYEEQTGIKANEGGVVKPLESVENPEELTTFQLTRFKYGISKDLPTEFIAVLAESYFLGKNYFYQMYSPFLPEENTDRLYQFVKKEIFDGREYPDYHNILQKLESKK